MLAVLKSRYGQIQRSSRMLQDLERAEMWSEKVKGCSSNIKPRLRAEWSLMCDFSH